MKSKISALMDGGLEPREAAPSLDALATDGEMRDAWRSYHLIGDAMRGTRVLSEGFSGRVAAKLAAEPTVLAPARGAPAPGRPRWQLLSLAASVAAVAMVSSVWFALQDFAGPAPQVAQAPRPALPARQAEVAQARGPAQVQPPDSANDYLYAHQVYSPRNTLQGVAPYVRMVSGEARPDQK
jgi:sigma-E factor negative regulatory protein RseA